MNYNNRDNIGRVKYIRASRNVTRIMVLLVQRIFQYCETLQPHLFNGKLRICYTKTF